MVTIHQLLSETFSELQIRRTTCPQNFQNLLEAYSCPVRVVSSTAAPSSTRRYSPHACAVSRMSLLRLHGGYSPRQREGKSSGSARALMMLRTSLTMCSVMMRSCPGTIPPHACCDEDLATSLPCPLSICLPLSCKAGRRQTGGAPLRRLRLQRHTRTPCTVFCFGSLEKPEYVCASFPQAVREILEKNSDK